MDYKKKYKEEVVRATQLWECGDITRENLEYIFPELKEIKESEDEKIRKALIDYFDDANKADENPLQSYGIHTDKAIAWLEKRGEQKPYGQRKECEDCQFNYAGECKGFCQMKKDEQKSADKVEPKFHESEWVVYECAEETATLQITRIVGKTYVFSDNSTLGVVDEDALRLWDLTKDAKDGDVLVTPLPKGCEAGEQIFVFKGINSRDYVDNCIEYYCRICQGVFYENEIGYMGTTSETFYPATKEQRDTLMKAMADAGYEWSEETHELKKIEDEEYNGEDYGIDSLFHAQRILEKTLGSVGGYQTDDGILAHQCAISAVKKLYEQKPVSITDEWIEDYWQHEKVNNPYSYDKGEEIQFDHQGFVRFCKKYCKKPAEWSEEDEYMLDETIQHLKQLIRIDKAKHCACDVQYYQRDIDWLKSLRPQKQWKPTEAQLASLTIACDRNDRIGFDLTQLLKELKKL